MQESEPLRGQDTGPNRDPGDISTGSIETRDEPEPNGIITSHERDRNRVGCFLGGGYRRAIRKNYCDATAYQFSRKCWQPLVLIVRPAVFDCDIATLDIAGLVKALFERVRHRRVPLGRRAIKKSNDGQACLRPRRQRPRCRRAAEQRDELAPRAHSITSSARASSVGGTSRPSALAVFRLMISSYLVGACTGRSAGFSPFRMRST